MNAEEKMVEDLKLKAQQALLADEVQGVVNKLGTICALSGLALVIAHTEAQDPHEKLLLDRLLATLTKTISACSDYRDYAEAAAKEKP